MADEKVVEVYAIGVEGFEPPNGGTKNRCLTTWRHPRAKNYDMMVSKYRYFSQPDFRLERRISSKSFMTKPKYIDC